MKTHKRFSRETLLEYLREQADGLRKFNGFTSDTGWAQVENRSTDFIVEYGRWDELERLIREIEAEEIP